jgi:hypothetical protein
VAQNSTVSIPRSTDQRLNQVFSELSKKWQGNDGQASLAGGVTTPCGFRNEPPAAWAAVLEQKAYLADTVSMQIAGLQFVVTRGDRKPLAERLPYTDELQITWNPQQTAPNDLDRIAIVGDFQSQLGRIDKLSPGEGVTSEIGPIAMVHNEVLSRLELLNEDLVRKTDNYRTELESRFDARVKSLDEALELKQKNLATEFETKEAALAEERKGIEAQLADIDARDNTIVRREIRDGMLQEVVRRVQKFGLSADTQSKRLPVMIGIFSILVFLFVLLGATVLELHSNQIELTAMTSGWIERLSSPQTSSDTERAAAISKAYATALQSYSAIHDPSERYWQWSRLALASIGIITTLLFYVRWQGAWAERHANAEFQLQQFHLDVNRASWVMESCLEWEKETSGAPIPVELLSSISRNLFFDRQAQTEQVMHPADELASAILGSAAKVKLNTGAAEVEINNPGKRLSKSIAAKSPSDYGAPKAA